MAETTIRVSTEPDIDGVYRVTLELGEDHSVGLDEIHAMAYASEILRACALAEYDAAVVAQMAKLDGRGGKASGPMLVKDLREDRPPLTWSTPLTLVPGVSAFTGEAFLRVVVDGKPIGQWNPTDARQHALHVAESVHVAELDSGYYRMLRGVVGIEESVARAAIGDLAKYRPEG